ncbi:MAG: heme o synthase [Planctomycetota bacterium]
MSDARTIPIETSADETPGLLADYVALTKPRIARLVTITAGLGFALAVAAGEAWTWLGLFGSLAGTAASCMAASVFNQAWEKQTDARMPRTRNRPIAAGRITREKAVWFGVALMLLGQGLLCAMGTPLASAIAGLTILLYVLVYTPMKRVSPWALWVGAVPGALPPVIGYAAATRSSSWEFPALGQTWVIDVFGRVDAIAWVVFAVMVFWQIPHFLGIAWMYRKDYAAGGLPMRPVVDPAGRWTAVEALVGCVLLLVAVLWPVWAGMAGWGYAAVSGLACVVFTATAVRFAARRDDASARVMFFVSLPVLPVLLGALVAAGFLGW